jgi:hypothetical protein
MHPRNRFRRPRQRWTAAGALMATAGLLAGSLAAPAAAAPAATTSLRTGMTWSPQGQSNGYVHAGADGTTNPYSGDTTVDQYLPVLCLLVDGRPAPGGITFDYYNGWSRGAVKATAAVRGADLVSRAAADAMCAQSFGTGWRMAEFHDGRYGASFEYAGGWSYWAAGQLTPGSRYWVAIDDQPANPWNSAGDMPAPSGTTSDELILKTRLQELVAPMLSYAKDSRFRDVVRNGTARQYDGDTDVLLDDVVRDAEQAGIVDPNSAAWQALKAQIAQFANINGTAYQPHLFIPNYGDGAVTSTNPPVAVYDTDLGHTSVAAYETGADGNIQQRAGLIDETYSETHEVWVLGISENENGGAAAASASAAKTSPGGKRGSAMTDGTTAACNPTGLRNNKGLEYLQWFQVPNPSVVESWLSGKLEVRVIVLGKGGVTVKNAYYKIKRKTARNGTYIDLFLTTWDRALLGDYFGYKWIEEDHGPTITATLGITAKLFKDKLGITASVQAVFKPDNDDMGEGLVQFDESTYLQYSTGVVEWRVCSVGGDGGTGNTNLALSATAAAQSTYPYEGYAAAHVKDGSQDTSLGGPYSWVNGGSYTPNGGVPNWVQLDFGVTKTFSRVVVFTTASYPIRDYDIQVWNGSTWVTVAAVTGNTAASVTSTFASQSSRLIRILGRSGPTWQPGYVRVNEFEVYQ